MVPITIPEFGGDEVALLPPLFPEPQGKWLMGREQRKPDQPQVDYPFMLHDQPFVPAAKPVVPSGQTVEFSLVGYNLDADKVSVTSRLLGPGGSPVKGGELVVGERRATGTIGAEQLTMTFTPTRLTAGEYELELTVSNAETGSERSTSIPIVVGG